LSYQTNRYQSSIYDTPTVFLFGRLAKKKGRKPKDGAKEEPKDGKKSQAAGKGVSASQEKVKGKEVDHTVSKTGSTTERPESHQTEKSDSQTTADAEK